MFEPRLQSYLDTIWECLDLIQRRLSGINRAEDLIRSEEGMLIMDGIAIRLQLIGETVKKMEHHYPGFLSSNNIDPNPSFDSGISSPTITTKWTTNYFTIFVLITCPY